MIGTLLYIKYERGNIMNITKFNKAEILFTNNEKFEEFKTLEELYTEFGSAMKYKVLGVFNYKSTYGDGSFIKSEGFNISLPNHLNSTIKDIRNDIESVEEINSGKVYIKIYPYTLEKYPDKTFYSVNFIG